MSNVTMTLWVCTERSGKFMLDADMLDGDEGEEIEISCPYCCGCNVGQYYTEGVLS